MSTRTAAERLLPVTQTQVCPARQLFCGLRAADTAAASLPVRRGRAPSGVVGRSGPYPPHHLPTRLPHAKRRDCLVRHRR